MTCANKIACDVWNLMDDLDIDLSISHLPGKFNQDVDLASRLINYRTKWCLPKKYFKLICKHFSFTPSIDMFTSRLNHRLPRYILYAPDLHCVHVDCFTMQWSSEKPYLFPPFNLINRTLQII